MSRRVAVFGPDGLISETYTDVEWKYVRFWRTKFLSDTDYYYFADKWDTLNTHEKGKLNAYRKALRDLPQDYENANDAYDAMMALEVPA